MANNKFITIEQIIAKIDNDFNPDNSDWIPRVAAWCTDAMNQLKILRKAPKSTKLKVIDKIAKSYCCLDDDELHVYDEYGCEIPRANKDNCESCISSTGFRQKLNNEGTSTTDIKYSNYKEDIVYSVHRNTPDVTKQTEVHSIESNPRREYNYILADAHTIELNFDTEYITVTHNEIVTQYSDYYKCELPVIPNNGLLIESLSYYCMYKMLTRGYKHPVFNLTASQYGTNPYYLWTQLKEKAKVSIINDMQTNSDEWRNWFYNSTFPNR